MKIWKVKLIEEAKKDFRQLDGRQKRLVLKQLVKLEQEPAKYGKPRGNKAGYDLTGYYKLYADKKAIRIIYTIEDDVVKVIAIDKRDDFKVYKIANERLKKSS